MQGEATAPTGLPLTSLLTIGADLFGEVQRIIGSSRVRGLRIKLGGRILKEVAVAPLTAATTVILVVLAVIISNISIEVEHEPSVNAVNEARP
jgi:hypothetical protein